MHNAHKLQLQLENKINNKIKNDLTLSEGELAFTTNKVARAMNNLYNIVKK